MTFEGFISIAVIVASLSTKTIGAPHQIRLIMKTKTVHNISLLHYSIIFITYILWVIHGILKKDITVIISQSIGVLMSAILLSLIIYYKHFYKKDE